jgi:predicted phage terminase large subunit-like protein
MVVIATRWHEADLPGWLLKEHASEGWRVISLPAIAGKDDAFGRSEGEPLWPERFPLDALNRIKEAIGTSAWVSLYQQRPTLEEGAVFKRDASRTYSETPACERVIFSIDTAFKTGEQNDYSVCEVWGQTATGFALLHVLRERLTFPELVTRTQSLAAFWKPHAVLIEDAASGRSLIQSLQSSSRLPILPVKPLGDKQARASSVAPLVEAGRVLLPDSAPWLPDFIDEVTSFPAAPYDDVVDALSQALTYLRENDVGPFGYEGLPRYSHNPWHRSGERGYPGGSCDEQDRLDDMMGDATCFITGGSQQMQSLSARDLRSTARWRSLSRRRAW